MEDETRVQEKYFVEEVGVFFKQIGLPRMAGRILGWLLISDSPQSGEELAKTLTINMSSVSTAVNTLIRTGLVERLSRLGERHDCFRIRAGAWRYFIKHNLEQFTMLRQLAERGLALRKDKPPLPQQPLQEMYDMSAFFERESLALLERWGKRRSYD